MFVLKLSCSWNDEVMFVLSNEAVFVFQGGVYMLQLIDNYAATYSVLIIGLCECLALSYVYGQSNVQSQPYI